MYPLRVLLLSATVAFFTSACSNSLIDQLAVSGPSVVLKEAEVESSTKNYIGVRESFYHRAGFDPASPPPIGDLRWYAFIRHGWRHVDGECQRFLKALRDAEKVKQLVKNQLVTTASSVRNILNTMSASQKTLNIVAESLGLLTESVDNLSDSLLLRLPSSVVVNDVQKRQITEREKVRVQIYRRDQQYLSEIGAFEAIGDYLKLCLVHQIEARIPNNLSLTDYVALPDGRIVPVGLHAAGSQIRVDNDIANVKYAAELRKAQFESATKLVDARTQKAEPRPRPKPKNVIKGGQSEFEKGLDERAGKYLQRKLCVKPDGDFGATTREAIAYFKAYDRLYRTGELILVRDPNGALKSSLTVLDGRRDRAILNQIEALDDCPSTYKNVYERTVWNEDNNQLVNQRSSQFSAKVKNRQLGCALTFVSQLMSSYQELRAKPQPTEDDKKTLLAFEAGAELPQTKIWATLKPGKIDEVLVEKLMGNGASRLDGDVRAGFKLMSELAGLPVQDVLTPPLYKVIRGFAGNVNCN